MTTTRLLAAMAVLILVHSLDAAVPSHPAKATAASRPVPAKPTSHTIRQIEGWTVHLDDRLFLESHARLGDRAVRLLDDQLYNIVLVVAADRVERLRKVPIWLDLTHGALERPQYHPSAQWLRSNGYEPLLAKCIHIPDANYFAAARFQYEQPCAVLHELAHAYHDQVLGFEEPEIMSAWRRFVDGGHYKSVLHISGQMRQHYALADHKEFFAEMTESYFGHNDFYPFNSAELRREEPEIFQLLERIWGPLPGR